MRVPDSSLTVRVVCPCSSVDHSVPSAPGRSVTFPTISSETGLPCSSTVSSMMLPCSSTVRWTVCPCSLVVGSPSSWVPGARFSAIWLVWSTACPAVSWTCPAACPAVSCTPCVACPIWSVTPSTGPPPCPCWPCCPCCPCCWPSLTRSPSAGCVLDSGDDSSRLASGEGISDVAQKSALVLAPLLVALFLGLLSFGFGLPGLGLLGGFFASRALPLFGLTLPFLLLVPSYGACGLDRKSTRLNSSHANISYVVFCLKK